MFTRMRLTNFKAWRDTGEIALRPVTMLLGTNSSGKSSLIQSLLLLKQTVQSPDRTVHLNLGGDETNDLFNFGSFEDVLKQGTESPRHFSITFDFEDTAVATLPTGRFSAVYGQTSAGAVTVQSLSLQSGARAFRAIRREKGAFSIQVDHEQLGRGKSRHFSPERSIALPAEAIALLGVDGQLAEDLSLAIRRQLVGISYLGPIRREPERDYVWNKSSPGEIGGDGRRAVDVLLASAVKRSGERREILAGVSAWLNRMRLADRLEVRQLGRSTRFEVVVHRDGVVANMRDVGFGVSQVLPVLVIAQFAPAGSTILLEEPEIHLHPLAQSVLAELFVEVSRERGVQFIVETHSEHLFRRMQTLIARREVTARQVAMHFVERTGADATLRELEVDEFGAVRNWPLNFFGDSVGEARAQAMARAERLVRAPSQ